MSRIERNSLDYLARKLDVFKEIIESPAAPSCRYLPLKKRELDNCVRSPNCSFARDHGS